ncbi:Dephospho-CoA kinase [Aphelenchoides fujianensis]|nr:Dephospho-CoA kinase [Aphelenchoides fujianensis]
MFLVGLTGGIASGKSVASKFFHEHGVRQRRKLNAIVHPAIRRQIVLQTLGSLLTFERFVVVDIPLLFESKLEGFFQNIVVVHCTVENHVQRLCRRDGISEEQARARIAAQLPAAYKIEKSLFIPSLRRLKYKRPKSLREKAGRNLEQLHAQLDALLVQLEASWIPLAVRSALGLAVLLAAVVAFRLWS